MKVKIAKNAERWRCNWHRMQAFLLERGRDEWIIRFLVYLVNNPPDLQINIEKNEWILVTWGTSEKCCWFVFLLFAVLQTSASFPASDGKSAEIDSQMHDQRLHLMVEDIFQLVISNIFIIGHNSVNTKTPTKTKTDISKKQCMYRDKVPWYQWRRKV